MPTDRQPRIAPVKSQEDLARSVAKTKGEQSEAAKALRELAIRRNAGEEVIVFPLRSQWLVGTPAEVSQEVSRVAAARVRQRGDTRRVSGTGAGDPEALVTLRAAAKRSREDLDS